MDKEEKKRIKKERLEKFKAMSLKEKIEFFEDYYLLRTVVILVIVGCIIGIVYTYFTNRYEKKLSIILVDCNMDNAEAYKAELTKFLKLDGKKERVAISNNYILNDADGIDPEVYQSITTFVYVGDMDVYIGSKKDLPIFAKNNYFMDLSEFLDSETLRKLEKEERLYYYSQSAEDESGTVYTLSKPVGIILDGLEIVSKAKIVADEPVIAISASSPNKENVIKFIEYILE